MTITVTMIQSGMFGKEVKNISTTLM